MRSDSPGVRELLEGLEAEFGDVVHPGVTNLPDKHRDSEGEDIMETFGTTHWRDVPVDVLMARRSSLGFFSPVGFHYYLPAFMRAALTAPESIRFDILDYTMMLLAPGVGETWTADDEIDFQGRIAPFSEKQRDVIRSFLDIVRAEHSEFSWPALSSRLWRATRSA